MIITVSDHMQETLGKVQIKLNYYTYPVFINASNNRPDLIASAVAIQNNSKSYLVTASHVLNQIEKASSQFYLGLKEQFICLEGEFIRSMNRNTKRDDFDIAFYELKPEFVSDNSINVLQEKWLMIKQVFNSIHLSCIHGYPCSKNKQGSAMKGGNKFSSFAFTYAGKRDDSFNNWTKYNKNCDFHACMNYGRAKDCEGTIVTPPSPKGISGGGLWVIPDSFCPEKIYLEGIFIEYYEKDKISFSTKMSKVIEFIESNN